jgi:hypothetical protein
MAGRWFRGPQGNPLLIPSIHPPHNERQWPSREACCAPGAGAFGEGCSTYVPKAPCFVVDSYDPVRKCRREEDIARCSRGAFALTVRRLAWLEAGGGLLGRQAAASWGSRWCHYDSTEANL